MLSNFEAGLDSTELHVAPFSAVRSGLNAERLVAPDYTSRPRRRSAVRGFRAGRAHGGRRFFFTLAGAEARPERVSEVRPSPAVFAVLGRGGRARAATVAVELLDPSWCSRLPRGRKKKLEAAAFPASRPEELVFRESVRVF